MAGLVWALTFTGLASAITTLEPENAALLSPTEIQESTTKNILDALREQHYVDQVLDDEVSSEVFDGYIDDLDPSKSYFTQSDLDALSHYRFELDNALRR
ncbi:MAG: tail-specific protease, partial [Betaproteobacteria bacterium]